MSIKSNTYLGLIVSVSRLYRSQVPPSPEAGDLVRCAAQALEQISSPVRDVQPARLPAYRHLAAAAALAQGSFVQNVVRAFLLVEPYLAWRQNPNYDQRQLGESFMDNYAFCEFVGLQGPAGDGTVIVGMLLLGPGQLYPDHRHAAAEIYHVLGGTSQWRSGKRGWAWQPPGSCLYHAPWETHAMRCTGEPLLALYAWQGQTSAPASLTHPRAKS